ncbi:MAG: biotin-dependent carboxyltransferase family protein, partial [Gordonia sp. (in: high G+C Gram-positive bacteria)]
LSAPVGGARNYVAVRGGIDVPPVLGSRSTDTLSGLGPPALSAGTRLPVGAAARAWPATMTAPISLITPDVVELAVRPGPRAGLMRHAADLRVGRWEVTADANRVGVRLTRPHGDPAPLLEHREHAGELRSEGVAHGSVQIPPTGRPVLFLADHPVTGGYPVIAVLTAASISRAGQLVAGMRIRFRTAPARLTDH